MSQVAPQPLARPRRSQPEQARLILLGTAAVVTGVLAAWLLLWILTRPPGTLSAGGHQPALPRSSGPSGECGLLRAPATPTSVGNGPAPVLRQPVECVPPRGDRAAADQAVTERLRLAEVHTLATGRGQLVAVIDTGVAPHPRLAGRVVGGGDFLGEGDGLEDCDGHGTAVAGILAAAPGPDGVVGMAPGARVLAIRQFSGVLSGSGRAGDPDTLAAAIVTLPGRAGAQSIAIVGGRVLPVSGPVIENGTVVIDGGRITAVGATVPTALVSSATISATASTMRSGEWSPSSTTASARTAARRSVATPKACSPVSLTPTCQWASTRTSSGRTGRPMPPRARSSRPGLGARIPARDGGPC